MDINLNQKVPVTRLRRLTQILFTFLILLLPVFNILRYDVDTKELFLAGKVWSLNISERELIILEEKRINSSGEIAIKFILKAIIPWLTVLSFFPLLGFFLGRTFCGWLCPEGALFELADFLNRKLTGKSSIWQKGERGYQERHRFLYLFITIFLLVTIPPLIGIGLSGYFISPERIWKELSNLKLSFGLKAGIIGVSLYILITSIFIRHLLCKYICAAGLMQMLFGWISPVSLRLKFLRQEAQRCTDCRKCEEVCFMNIKPRKNIRDISCVNCMACVEACRKELGNGLFMLQFGDRGQKSFQYNMKGEDYGDT